MPQSGLTPDANLIDAHRLEWKKRLIEWLVPRLRDDCDKDTTLDMVMASLDEAYCEGIGDTASVLERVASKVRPWQQGVVHVMARNVRDLERRNRTGEPRPTHKAP